MKVTRTIFDASGRSMQAEKILEIDVKPGWKDGTKLTFTGEGDEIGPGSPAGDIVFILQQKPHQVFTREGDDLVINRTVSLKEALCGTHVMVDTLSGRRLKVNVRDVVRPGYAKRVNGEGMPSQKNPSIKGNLVIRFNVAWPHSLTEDQKEKLRAIL